MKKLILLFTLLTILAGCGITPPLPQNDETRRQDYEMGMTLVITNGRVITQYGYDPHYMYRPRYYDPGYYRNRYYDPRPIAPHTYYYNQQKNPYILRQNEKKKVDKRR